MGLLPSEKVFRIFEICSMYQNFTAAAEHLGISQGAVSQQIKALEYALGVELFIRKGRHVILSPVGSRVLEAQKRAFEGIRQATQIGQEEQRKSNLSILVHPGFSVRWLLPRLSEFQLENPDVNLTIMTATDLADFRDFTADAAILYTPLQQQDWLSQDFLIPVASPEFMATHELNELSQEAAVQKMVSLPMLGEAPTHTNDTWETWANEGKLQIPLDQIQRFPHSNMSLLLSELGQGIAMGRWCLIADALNSGILVPVVKKRVKANAGYLLYANPNRGQNCGLSRFEDWLKQAMQSLKNESSLNC
ncbi:LysR family transcriptional regulator [Pseudovibrio sp. Tun.PSC04-5.I4]|uniref:LysR family transcriptional regulator n=1 Tax=Pseudovibrio sp. Tun.PSC04-5.I4 TaxID=1798213 RepID=UPI00088E46E1|nr:LysR family transcriptional regulator [Pseudovibrio sp. Tun.PSC04-5.I4]SDQ18614.1 LysR family transcriptional regulator, glycine cleavage system transcriptional activator [Pseudovibrio sp. Tun.PSC04-5.I4]